MARRPSRSRQPAPGTIAVHLNGYLQFGIGDFGSSLNKYTTGGTIKLNPYTTNGDARLYAGFDAQTLNGIDYGAQIELRTTTSNAGSPPAATPPAPAAGTSSMYVKRAYGYIGTQQAGFVRLGQTDSAFTLLQTGVLEGFGDGAQWNIDGGIIQRACPPRSCRARSSTPTPPNSMPPTRSFTCRRPSPASAWASASSRTRTA